MALNIIAIFLVGAITFMHSMFGLFSGVINVVCSLIALMVAFGFYTPINDWLTLSFGLHPAYCEPVTLVLLFAATLAGLRTAADNLIRGNIHLPNYVDWVGGALCGFINAQIAVGVLVIGTLMLPLTGRVLMFERYERTPERDPQHAALAAFERHSLWTRPDEFAVGTFSLFSNGVVRGGTTFASVYPNFMDSVFFANNTVQPEASPVPYRDKKNGGDGFREGLRVVEWWEHQGPLEGRYRDGVPTERDQKPPMKPATLNAGVGRRLLGVHLQLLGKSADRSNRTRMHLFRASQIRLVGTSGSGSPIQYTPLAIAGANNDLAGAVRLVDLDNNFSAEGGDTPIYVYFEVGEDFRPAFIEYRRHARAGMNTEMAKAAPSPLSAVLAAATGGAPAPRESTGRAVFFEGGSGDNENLPFDIAMEALRRGSGSDIRLDGELFAAGRLFGNKDRFTPGPNVAVAKRFKLPEGFRLLQIKYQPKKAESIVGQVFNYAARVNQYRVLDSNANPYPLMGYYVTAKRGNQDIFEIFYNPPNDPVEPAYNGQLDFKHIEAAEVNNETTEVTLLFLVKRGSTVIRVENQKSEGADVQFKVGD